MLNSKSFATAALLVCGLMSGVGAQVTWTLRNPLPRMKVLQSVVWTGDQIIAVGDSGQVVTSPNGTTWTFRSTGVLNALASVASGGGTIVAVGAGGRILTSPDGVTWTTRTSSVTTDFRSIVWTGGRFVVVGGNSTTGGKIITSADGVTWTERSSPTPGILYGVTWTGSAVVAVGASGAVISSPDGDIWTGKTSGVSTPFYAVTYGGGRIVAVGGSSAGDVIRSTTDPAGGGTWTNASSQPSLVANAYLNSVAWTGSFYAAVGSSGNIITSADGLVWSARVSGTSEVLRAVAWTSTRLMAVGNAGVIRVSSNGTTWTSPALTTAGLNGIAWAEGKARVIAADGGVVFTSTEDTGWVQRSTGVTQGLYSVTWAGNQVVAVGAGGTVITSPDGGITMAWTARNSGTTNALNSVAWNGTNTLVAVGGASSTSGEIRASSDGTAWTARTPAGANVYIYAVAWCNTQFVAVGGGGNIWTSPTGVTWTSRVSNITQALRGVTCAGNQIVAVGLNGAITTSEDGITWTARSAGTSAVLYSVAYNGTSIVASGSGIIVTSTDGITWATQTIETSASLYSVTPTGNGWTVVGSGGAIFTSPQLTLPSAPVLALPLNSASGYSVYGPLSWEAVAGASYYRLQVATDSNFVGIVFNDTTSALSKGISTPGLAGNTQFFWRVRAHNNLGAGPFSPVRRFTTGTPPVDPPPAPALISPTIFATNVAVPVTLTWAASNGAETYHVQVSTTPNFASLVANDSGLTSLNRQVSSLNGGVEYYWRVRAKNGLGAGAWSGVSSFTTVLAVPAAPNLVSPAPFESDVNRQPTMTWEGVAGASSYRLQIATDPIFTLIIVSDSLITGTSSARSCCAPLTANFEYYWRVSAKNSVGYGNYSTVSKFTTGNAVAIRQAPGIPQFYTLGGNGYLRFALERPERVTARLYDLKGRLVAQILDETRGAGTHTLALPRGLGASLHLLEFRSGAKREWLTVHP